VLASNGLLVLTLIFIKVKIANSTNCWHGIIYRNLHFHFLNKIIMKKLIKLFVALMVLNTSVFGQAENDENSLTGEIIYHEPFDYPAGELPPGWVLDTQYVPWAVGNSNMAGGESPELFLGYSFTFGTIRLISSPVNIEGYQELCFRFKQYLINYEADYGEIIGVDLTYDGGQTWEVLWEKLIGLTNIPQDEFSYFFIPPDGATEMQFCFRFDGNNYAINLWAVDDVIIEHPVENDLLIATDAFFDGNTTPTAGEESIILVEVTNGGTLLQSDYTVKLMQEGGIELASVPGETIAFGEKWFFNLFWTPGTELIGNPVGIHAYVDLPGDENPGNNESRDLIINVQPENIATTQINPGSWPSIYLPYNFINLHSLTQTLYFPEEIGMTNMPVTAIQYTCLFDQELADVPVQIYMGETEKNDLSEGWIDPSTLTLVFDGSIDFAKGFNNLYIPLDNAYPYEDGNLVVYSGKSYTQMVIGTPFISAIDTGSMRSRSAERDDAPFDPMNPPSFSYTLDYYPNIALFYSTSATVLDEQPKVTVAASVFPNPASQLLNVRTNDPMLEIRMVNLLGQKVYSRNERTCNHQIDVGNLQPGIYLIEILTAKGLHTQKVRVARD